MEESTRHPTEDADDDGDDDDDSQIYSNLKTMNGFSVELQPGERHDIS
jgi:hypothetical protein